ncbi:hypothetical protein WMF93_10170 [Pseudomonas alkylphenolica]
MAADSTQKLALYGDWSRRIPGSVQCHGPGGVGGGRAFPAVGPSAHCAGMHRINTAASFIKYNMPLGKPGSLSDQQAWDVAAFINRYERPQDPRLVEGSIERTRVKYHANDGVNLYGQKVEGVLIGKDVL